jgi:hypothetical protein
VTVGDDVSAPPAVVSVDEPSVDESAVESSVDPAPP